MTFRQIVDHLKNRLFEFAAALMMLALAVHLALWPAVVNVSDFRAVPLGLSWLVGGFALAGGLRMAAIVANGSWPFYGPLLRAAGALSGALIWLQVAISLYVLGAPPSPNIPVYFVLSIAELVSLYRALALVQGDEVH